MAKNARTAETKLSTHDIPSIFHRISVPDFHRAPSGRGFGGRVFESIHGRPGSPSPDGRTIEGKKNKEPKKKPVYIRKEFPETWLWTEQTVK